MGLNSVLNSRAKHVDEDLLHPKKVEGIIYLSYEPTKQQLADVLTKGIASIRELDRSNYLRLDENI